MPLPSHYGSGSKSHTKEPRVESRYTSYVKNMKIFRAKIPSRLSFEEIVRNSTQSPSSLDNFMDYLVYVEHDAENLQFFLWFCSYVEKWSKLPEWERERSPVWGTGKRTNVRPHTRSERLGESVDRLNRILMILDRGTSTTIGRTASARQPGSKNGHADTNFSRPRTPAAGSEMKQETGKEWQWQPFSAQPFRDEVTQVVRHYISTSGPRKLNLAYQDRTACMHALQHTTHPSAFLPAFLTAETMLREHSHPNFIIWSVCNSNHPRVLFARALGSLLIVMAIILDVILILSRFNRLARLSAVPLWYIGFYILLIEGRGISIGLYMNHKRQLRPWEKTENLDPESGQARVETGQAESQNPTDASEKRNQDTPRDNVQGRQSLQPLGPANDFESEPWIRLYQTKPFWRKVFDASIVNRNRHLRAMQDRAIFTSLLWASLLVVVLTVVSVLIPSGSFF
ncbi:hypothetical protein F4804DRAFT_343335 [Jackrogersella minutella]|nr:hypothetical protein F4804DRAFT_343335 [Jackrogersella minutella]